MKRAIIIDVNSLLYKSFYKLMNMRSSKGFPTGALLGITNSIISILDKFKPDYFVACFDVSRDSLKRKEIFDDYKSNREGAPEDLALQIAKSKELISALGAHVLTEEGYEADDMIASAVKYFSENGIDSIVVTSDKDLMQLVPRASIFNHSKNLLVSTKEDVVDAMGVTPEQIVDLFALMGDSSDGIPGVKGIGPKMASKLVMNYGSVDGILENIDDLPEKLAQKIEENRDVIEISRKLAQLNTVDLVDIPTYAGFKDDLVNILEDLEFRSILKRLNLEKSEEISILHEEVEEILIKEDSLVYYEDSRYFLCEDKILISENINFNNCTIDTYNAKELLKIKDFNIGLDLLIAYHLLYPNERTNLDKAIRRVFNFEVKSSLERAYYLRKLREYLKEKLEEKELGSVYESIEKPLIKVLSKMESVGVEVDIDYLKSYQQQLEEQIASLTSDIVKLAGEEFNISSPKQLSFVLFEKLQLPSMKKTKTGYSTDAEVLEQLSMFEIVKKILDYRKLVKIYNTYVLPLIKAGPRVHTTYHQDGTATGRLSSSNPNLQNIPSRTEEGLKVRKAFTSSKGKLLILDYSQMELRILASLSCDESLLESYKKGEDLHNKTAMKLFGMLGREEREKAKIVNFSVIYGKSSFGLAKELGITLKEASNYIERYFEEYPGVKKFIKETVDRARIDGYVKTMFGRIRELKDINSRNRTLRNASERMAVNTVIQGTQAEIIKKAMIDIDKYIEGKNIDMIMQVHDELVFEIEDGANIDEIVAIMQNSVSLKVPIIVNKYIAKDWSGSK
ncbi:MAG TPA: DNA polymerase I [Fusobacteria bacterium]|nr:DNA polymerase I [Fusobacteriota bacterium]|tara:strand:- start:12500 stop:14875 length:2376 start_codon:yes stop_codon:yes gene_type:complete